MPLPSEDTMTQRLDPLATAAAGGTIQRWLDQQPESIEARNEKLVLLEEFCNFCNEGPDALIASLFRPTDDGPRINLKRRRQVVEWIESFERENGGRASGNIVRSFLIHNGVAMTANPTW
jgi:hypothetical protein